MVRGADLPFKGTILTQDLRNDHREIANICNLFIHGNFDVDEFIDQMNYMINYHFKIEENILFNESKNYLDDVPKYNEMVLLLKNEHENIKKYLEKYKKYKNKEFLKDMANVLLNHIYKEENGIYNILDEHVPDDAKEIIYEKIKNFLDY